jgi:uncharacterized protein
LRGAAFCAGALLLIGASCRREPQSTTPAATPTLVSGPRVLLPSGAVYSLEVARTPEETAQGLMFRESLRDRSGMLFLFHDGQPHRFWMKNTMIPLDMIWMDADGKVLFVSANTPPCRADPCPSYGPDAPPASVLEIAGGMAEKERITVGSRLRILDVPRPPAATPAR